MTFNLQRAFAPFVATVGISVAAAAQQGDVTVDWLVGRWSDAPDCSRPFYLLHDGRGYIAEGWSRWRLEGNVIVLTRPDGSGERRFVVQRINEHTLNANGVPSYRCEGRSDPRAP